MVIFENIKKIKESLPEVLHVVMVYADGTVYQTTFDESLNLPKIGEIGVKILELFQELYKTCNFNFQHYNKLIYETEGISCIILRLGEESNIALFFEKETQKDLKIGKIRRYLKKIEELTDVNQSELLQHELCQKQEEYQQKEKELRNIHDQIKLLQSSLELHDEADNQHLKEEIGSLQKEEAKLQLYLEQMKEDIHNCMKKIDLQQ